MEQIEFSQEELTTLIGIIGKVYHDGGITLGDAEAMSSITAKIKAKWVNPHETKNEVQKEPVEN